MFIHFVLIKYSAGDDAVDPLYIGPEIHHSLANALIEIMPSSFTGENSPLQNIQPIVNECESMFLTSDL